MPKSDLFFGKKKEETTEPAAKAAETKEAKHLAPEKTSAEKTSAEKSKSSEADLEKMIREFAKATADGFRGINSKFETIDSKLKALEESDKSENSAATLKVIRDIIDEGFAEVHDEIDALRGELNYTPEEVADRLADAEKLRQLHDRAKERSETVAARNDFLRRLDELAK